MSLKRSMTTCAVNILRVLRGSGNQNQIIQDIEEIAQETASTRGCAHSRCSASNELVSAVLGWRGRSEVSDTYRYCLGNICDASLRFVAAELGGNHTEYGKASNDMMLALAAWRRFDAAQEDELRQKEVSEMLRKNSITMRLEAVSKQSNDRVLSGVNDNEKCFVYFITDGVAIKIGKANDPRSRLRGLQTSHHKPLRIIAVIPGNERLERELHGMFQKHRLRGEWFRDCSDIRKFIATHTKVAA